MASREEANSQVVREICQSLADKNVAGIAKHLAEDAHWTVAGRPDRFQFGGRRDKAGSVELLEGFLGAFDDFEFIAHSLTAQDDRVAVRASSRGTSKTGAKYQNSYLMLYEFKDGKVFEAYEYFDQFEVLAYVEQMA